MTNETKKKYILLQENLQRLGSAAVAFSGGVDSAFLLKAAHAALGFPPAGKQRGGRLLPQGGDPPDIL